jgi:alpha-methylacyl-CoA racemase
VSGGPLVGVRAHNVVRNMFVQQDGVMQPAPAPRFSRTPGALRLPPPEPGRDTDAALAAWGFAADEIERLRADRRDQLST